MIRTDCLLRLAAASIVLILHIGCRDVPRRVAEDTETGFALYRSGHLSPADLETLCALGVEEILVLDGMGSSRECEFQETICPDLRVRYDHAQEEDIPVHLDFLLAFDRWIESAQSEGKRVAIRCRHGWHRTGRLAAYYRMRFEGSSAAEAIEEMQRIGRMMWRHPTLDPQIEAYADLIAESPCSVEPENCPSSLPDPGLENGDFPEDVCSP